MYISYLGVCQGFWLVLNHEKRSLKISRHQTRFPRNWTLPLTEPLGKGMNSTVNSKQKWGDCPPKRMLCRTSIGPPGGPGSTPCPLSVPTFFRKARRRLRKFPAEQGSQTDATVVHNDRWNGPSFSTQNRWWVVDQWVVHTIIIHYHPLPYHSP